MIAIDKSRSHIYERIISSNTMVSYICSCLKSISKNSQTITLCLRNVRKNTKNFFQVYLIKVDLRRTGHVAARIDRYVHLLSRGGVDGCAGPLLWEVHQVNEMILQREYQHEADPFEQCINSVVNGNS